MLGRGRRIRYLTYLNSRSRTEGALDIMFLPKNILKGIVLKITIIFFISVIRVELDKPPYLDHAIDCNNLVLININSPFYGGPYFFPFFQLYYYLCLSLCKWF